jgi:hypothetical protein
LSDRSTQSNDIETVEAKNEQMEMRRPSLLKLQLPDPTGTGIELVQPGSKMVQMALVRCMVRHIREFSRVRESQEMSFSQVCPFEPPQVILEPQSGLAGPLHDLAPLARWFFAGQFPPNSFNLND